MKKCIKCKKEKREADFSFKNKAKNMLHSYCKECTRLFVKNHYNKNKAYYLNKAYIRNNRLRKEVIEYIKQYFIKNHCVDCGESDPVVLEFDHIRDKIDPVSRMIRYRLPINKIKEEISKCDVRCANCHRRKTAKDFNWYKL